MQRRRFRFLSGLPHFQVAAQRRPFLFQRVGLRPLLFQLGELGAGGGQLGGALPDFVRLRRQLAVGRQDFPGGLFVGAELLQFRRQTQ